MKFIIRTASTMALGALSWEYRYEIAALAEKYAPVVLDLLKEEGAIAVQLLKQAVGL